MNKKKDIVIEINLSEYFHHNGLRVIQAIILAVFLIILAGVASAMSGGNGKGSMTEGAASELSDSATEAEEHGTLSDVQKDYDEVADTDEVTNLINNYYNAYAEGDTDTIETFCYPISEKEKGYIGVLSKYIDSYDDIKVYTKQGYDGDSYFVSAVYNIKFKDIKTVNPGMDFFYVCIDDNGSSYIDNTYSNFNMTSGDYQDDPNVTALILEFEKTDDVVALQKEIQEKYEEALEDDDELKTMMDKTLPNAVSEWATEYAEEQQKAEEKAAKEEKAEKNDSKSDEKDDSDKADSDKDKDDEEASGSDDTDDTKATESDNKDDEKASQSDDEKASETSFKAPFKKGDKIRLNESVNIRTKQSKKSDRVGLAFSGEYVKVIECYENGWTKVKWNKKTGYVLTEVLQEQ